MQTERNLLRRPYMRVIIMFPCLETVFAADPILMLTATQANAGLWES